jgi:hypothetical protein
MTARSMARVRQRQQRVIGACRVVAHDA